MSVTFRNKVAANLILSMVAFVTYVIWRLASEHEFGDPFWMFNAFPGQFLGIFDPGHFMPLWPLMLWLEVTVMGAFFWAGLNTRIEAALRKGSRRARIVRRCVPRFRGLFGETSKNEVDTLEDMHLYVGFAGIVGSLVTVIQLVSGWSHLTARIALQALLGLYIWSSSILYGWSCLVRFVRGGMKFK
ncbi:MAG TPA: hypothetical protein VN765_13330 [Candidatus Acidoferrum sp.]|nr:hypothetical protein [Candidatus Acidoferrum sp.]